MAIVDVARKYKKIIPFTIFRFDAFFFCPGCGVYVIIIERSKNINTCFRNIQIIIE